jgi:hypothetical protein
LTISPIISAGTPPLFRKTVACKDSKEEFIEGDDIVVDDAQERCRHKTKRYNLASKKNLRLSSAMWDEASLRHD